MAGSNYNAYNYHPYQQSSARQYPPYSTAPASSTSHHSHQPPSTQATDYVSYQAQAYGNQSNTYGSRPDKSWRGGNYGSARDNTNQAAEVLRNMSNTSSSPSSSSAFHPNYTAKQPDSHPAARYRTTSSSSPNMHAQQMHKSHVSYAQSDSRPQSGDTYRAQADGSRGLPSPASAAGYPVQHYPEYSNQQLGNTGPARSDQHATHSTSYNHTKAQSTRLPEPIVPPPISASGAYVDQSSTTVDPTAVYDPWPEYQRQAEARRAQKAADDAARAEEERKVEEKRKVEEEAYSKREQETERARNAATQSKATPQKQDAAGAAGEPSSAAHSEQLEAEIRAMMAKMRELNSKDPSLLARIWEEERRAKPKPSTEQNKTPAPPATVSSAPPAPDNTQKVANSKKQAVPKEKTSASGIKAPTTAPPPAPVVIPPVQATPASHGSTIWPAEKKTALATAAAKYINLNNPNQHTDIAFILSMLNENPSYIGLCGMLENTGLKLDRAAFAKNLLTAVPDVNSRRTAPQPAPVHLPKPIAPPAVIKKQVTTPAAVGSISSPTMATPYSAPSYTPVPMSATRATPVPVAEMVPIKAELKPPANKEEAARKRNLSDLVDFTQLDDDEDVGPPPKKLSMDTMPFNGSPQAPTDDTMAVDNQPVHSNFPTVSGSSRPVHEPSLRTTLPPPQMPNGSLVKPLDKKKALRRNAYNPATIARDVLLACGRHPSERQLNQHLNALRTNIPSIGFDSDLSTIKWDIIDPGNPPPGYFKDSVQALTEDADDEEEHSDEEPSRPRASINAIGVESGGQTRVQALPEAANPFKQQKRRGRPPRHSSPNTISPAPSTPKTSQSSPSTNMTTSVPRSTSGSVGYAVFRSATEYGPDGQPLPKKRGRPVGWRKAIHGSPAAQAGVISRKSLGGAQPSQPSALRNVQGNENDPIRVDSRSPSVSNRLPTYQSYKCKWGDCSADLHNLETLKKHIFKVHRRDVHGNTQRCLWDDCSSTYTFEIDWRDHINNNHLAPLSWRLGDGPVGGLSDVHDSESYLSDAQGRQVTPRIRASQDSSNEEAPAFAPVSAAAPRGRGRPPKKDPLVEAREVQDRLTAQKERLGGPGMDRGGATLVNDKRRRGFVDSDGMDEELVDSEESFTTI